MVMMLAISDAMAQTPEAKITKFWIDQDIEANNGLRVHVNFEIYGWKEKFVHCRLFLYDKSKLAWLDRNYSVLKSDNLPELGDCKTFRVKYDNCKVNDFQLYISKDAMQLEKGVNSYYCCVELTVMDKGSRVLARSGLQSFKANGVGNLVGCTTTKDGFSTSYPYKGMLNDYTNASASSSTSARKSKSENLSLTGVYNFSTANGFMELMNSNGKRGLYNHTKDQWMIQPLYSFDGPFYVNSNNFGYIVAKNSNERYGVFDTNGRLVIPFNYSWISCKVVPGFLFLARDMNRKEGIIDVNGQTVCPFIYDEISTAPIFNRPVKKLSEALLTAKKNGKEGLIDLTGKPITDFIYDFIYIEEESKYKMNYVTNNYEKVKSDYYAYFDYNKKRYYVDDKWDVIKIEEKESRSTYSQNKPSNSSGSNSGVKTAAAIGVFVGLAAVIIDAISSSSSSSSTSSYSSSSSSYSSSSSSSSSSVCTYCTGRGMENCVWCHGSGIISGGWFEEDQICFSCKGQGRVWCWHCSGRGTVRN